MNVRVCAASHAQAGVFGITLARSVSRILGRELKAALLVPPDLAIARLEFADLTERSWASAVGELADLREWYEADMDEVVGRMLSDYEVHPLALPYGMLPCFFLTAGSGAVRRGKASPVQCGVGFQPWSYTSTSC